MHRVCGQCGKYRGRIVVDVLKKTTKKVAKKKTTKSEEGKRELPEAKVQTK
jgi:ribosomal protein L32